VSSAPCMALASWLLAAFAMAGAMDVAVAEEKVVELNRERGPATIRSADTKKNTLKPHLKAMGHSGRTPAPFVANMEDVLDVIISPTDPACPVSRVDETSKTMIAKSPCDRGEPGRTARFDSSISQWHGHLFMTFAPVGRLAHVKITDRRRRGFPQVLRNCRHAFSGGQEDRTCSDISAPKPASLYRPFPPRGTAARRALRLALTTPNMEVAQYGDLNSASSRLSVLSTYSRQAA